MVMVEVAEEYGLPLKVTDQDVSDGSPVSLNVTEGSMPKFAVIVPGAVTVAVAEALVADEKVIEAEEDVHELKA